METKEQLRTWFQRGLKPTQAQFWAWMDSYWHKGELIPMVNVVGLEEHAAASVAADADLQAQIDGIAPAATSAVLNVGTGWEYATTAEAQAYVDANPGLREVEVNLWPAATSADIGAMSFAGLDRVALNNNSGETMPMLVVTDCGSVVVSQGNYTTVNLSGCGQAELSVSDAWDVSCMRTSLRMFSGGSVGSVNLDVSVAELTLGTATGVLSVSGGSDVQLFTGEVNALVVSGLGNELRVSDGAGFWAVTHSAGSSVEVTAAEGVVTLPTGWEASWERDVEVSGGWAHVRFVKVGAYMEADVRLSALEASTAELEGIATGLDGRVTVLEGLVPEPTSVVMNVGDGWEYDTTTAAQSAIDASPWLREVTVNLWPAAGGDESLGTYLSFVNLNRAKVNNNSGLACNGIWATGCGVVEVSNGKYNNVNLLKCGRATVSCVEAFSTYGIETPLEFTASGVANSVTLQDSTAKLTCVGGLALLKLEGRVDATLDNGVADLAIVSGTRNSIRLLYGTGLGEVQPYAESSVEVAAGDGVSVLPAGWGASFDREVALPGGGYSHVRLHRFIADAADVAYTVKRVELADGSFSITVDYKHGVGMEGVAELFGVGNRIVVFDGLEDVCVEAVVYPEPAGQWTVDRFYDTDSPITVNPAGWVVGEGHVARLYETNGGVVYKGSTDRFIDLSSAPVTWTLTAGTGTPRRRILRLHGRVMDY